MTQEQKFILTLENFCFWHLVIDAAVLAYFLSRWFTALSRVIALRFNIVSLVNHRSSHTVPTARLGGVGLALGFGTASAILLAFLDKYLNPPFGILPFNHQLLTWIALGWLMIFIVGLLDDVFDLPPLVKLGLSIVAVLLPLLGGRLVSSFFNPPSTIALWISIGTFAFWMLFFVNGYNFMDGMDGFAAGFAQLAALFFFVITVWVNPHLIRVGVEFLLLPVLAAACWGFLHWNNPPAKVFMGDGGSLSVGYLLAIYVLLSLNPSYDAIPTLSTLTILLPFIFDVVLTLIRRARRGENLMKAHREHLYQRLMRSGMSHAEVLRLTKRTFWICNLLALAGAATRHPLGRLAAFAAAFGVMLWYWRYTLRRERAAGA